MGLLRYFFTSFQQIFRLLLFACLNRHLLGVFFTCFSSVIHWEAKHELFFLYIAIQMSLNSRKKNQDRWCSQYQIISSFLARKSCNVHHRAKYIQCTKNKIKAAWPPTFKLRLQKIKRSFLSCFVFLSSSWPNIAVLESQNLSINVLELYKIQIRWSKVIEELNR